ncbi:MAG TPA: hypothetical protein PKA32_04905, partial [Candidatus Gracilibacteria bacterium]|nr:hypothetical protein [Candidatus Gracilibacteria bacterium]
MDGGAGTGVCDVRALPEIDPCEDGFTAVLVHDGRGVPLLGDQFLGGGERPLVFGGGSRGSTGIGAESCGGVPPVLHAFGAGAGGLVESEGEGVFRGESNGICEELRVQRLPAGLWISALVSGGRTGAGAAGAGQWSAVAGLWGGPDAGTLVLEECAAGGGAAGCDDAHLPGWKHAGSGSAKVFGGGVAVGGAGDCRDAEPASACDSAAMSSGEQMIRTGRSAWERFLEVLCFN